MALGKVSHRPAATPEPKAASTEVNPQVDEARRGLVYAELADAAHGFDAITGRHRLEPDKLAAAGLDANAVSTPSSGFKTGLLREEAIGEFVLALPGTEDWADWKTNLARGTGGMHLQYRQAVDPAVNITEAVGRTKWVGHSLGSALTAALAIASRSEALTLNAAGLHANTIHYAETGASRVTHSAMDR